MDAGCQQIEVQYTWTNKVLLDVHPRNLNSITVSNYSKIHVNINMNLIMKFDFKMIICNTLHIFSDNIRGNTEMQGDVTCMEMTLILVASV